MSRTLGSFRPRVNLLVMDTTHIALVNLGQLLGMKELVVCNPSHAPVIEMECRERGVDCVRVADCLPDYGIESLEKLIKQMMEECDES